jgi:hypothetical protein
MIEVPVSCARHHQPFDVSLCHFEWSKYPSRQAKDRLIPPMAPMKQA